MLPEESIHSELSGFGPEIVTVISSTGFFEQDGPYNPLELRATPQAKARYVAASQQKNSRVWDLVKPYILAPAIADGILNFEEEYLESRVPVRKIAATAQDYMNDYAKKEGGKFITRMTQTDQKKIIDFIWANAGQNERPFARSILKNNPHLSYLVDNNQWRLKTIKRTEVQRATNYGETKFAADNDFKTKTWHTAGDWRVRPTHRANAGITVPNKDKFPNGEEYPGQSSINCRCHLSYDLDTKRLTKDAEKVYATRLPEAEADYKAAVKEHTSKATPLKKKIEKDIEPRKVAPKVEPKRVAEVKEELKKVAPNVEPTKPSSQKKITRQAPINFTFEERTALKDYTQEDYSQINKYLRGQLEGKHPETIERVANQVASIDSAMKKGVLPEQTVYRALNHDEWFKNLDGLKGATIEDKAFISTSKSRKLAEGYASSGKSRILMEISVPKGSTGIDIIDSGAASTGLLREESEVLLARGSKFKIIETGQISVGMQDIGYIKAELIQ